MPLAVWIHDLSPFVIKFTDNFGIRYYGLAYLAGFVASAWLLHVYWKKGLSPFPLNVVMDLMTFIVLGVLLGGRLGYFFLYQFPTMRADPFAIFRVWEGGMASHGAFIGVVLALWWWGRKRHVPMLQVGDVIATTVPVGVFFGRIANFINGELWGKPTDGTWGVIFARTDPTKLPRHPSQLYEAGLEGLVLLAYMQWRFWSSETARQQTGRLSGEFLIAYALVRMIGEVFREPDASLLFGLSRGTFYSIFLILAGAWLIARARKDR